MMASDSLRGMQDPSGVTPRGASVTVEDPYAGQSDADLATLVDRGDGQGLAALCRRYYREVFRSAYRLTQNLPEAEDCTQEAFARFIRNWSSWQERSQGAGPWLNATVRDVVAERWQKQFNVARINDPLVVIATGTAGTTAPANTEAMEREFQAAVEKALRGMDAHCRALLELVFRHGMTLGEASPRLRESPEAAKRRYRQCLERLKASLGEWGIR